MDYEQRYKDALRRAKKLYGEGTITECLGWVFPELKESEDEKVRKALIEYFNEQCDMSDWNGIYGYKVVNWLEKQGHMLNADSVIEWLECEAFQGWAEPIDIRPIIRKFKKDFGL